MCQEAPHLQSLGGEASSSEKSRREKMWGCFHQICSLEKFAKSWATLVEESTGAIACLIFYQYVTNSMFKELVKDQEVSLTYEEVNTLRYTVGYFPRALQKKLESLLILVGQ